MLNEQHPFSLVADAVDIYDQVTEAFYGFLGHQRMRETQDRVHWICRQVHGKNVLDVGLLLLDLEAVFLPPAV